MNTKNYLLIVASCWLPVLSACNSETTFSGAMKKSYDQKASQVYSFYASEIVEGRVTLADGGRFGAYELVQSDKPASKVIHKQTKRNKFSHQFKQGHNSKFSQEEFQLSEAGMLDFLIVVDDSRSMSDEQAMVGKGLAPLISEFKDTNWQIAVISMSNPCVSTSNLIKKTDANADKKFESAVRKPFDNSALEQGFPMAIQALKGQCNGSIRGWLRDGSTLGVLFLSDEDNCGSDSGELARCRNLPGKNAAEMVAYLRSIRSEKEARVYGIVDKDGSCEDAAGVGAMYVEAANATGGSVGSICHDYTNSAGYGVYLKSVSTDVNKILKRQFTLTSVPDLSRFEVAVDGQPIDANSAVTINGKIVNIDPKIIRFGAKITFAYTHGAVPMFNEVPTEVVPVLSSIDLRVNNTKLNLNHDFKFHSTKRVIEFVQQPPEDAEVSLSYLEDMDMKTKFAADFIGVRRDTVKVSVNGVDLAQTEFSVDDDGVLLASAPTDGAFVNVEWKTEGHKNLNYPMKIKDQRQPVAWMVKDKASGAEVPAKWTMNEIEFESTNVEDGRVVELFVDFGEKSLDREIALGQERIDEEVHILADGVEGVCEMKDERPSSETSNEQKGRYSWSARYKGSNVKFKCKEGSDYSSLEIKFLHEKDRKNVFEVNLPKSIDPDDKDLGWVVYVDGVKIQDFERRGTVVEIEDSKLPPKARVDIEVITYEKIER